MGRPIKSLFFGNTNRGATRRSDDHIGGEGVASVAVNTAGSFTSMPTITFGAPEIPTGVTATGTIHAKALSAVVNVAGDGYNIGDTIVPQSSGTGTNATFTVTGIKVTGITLKNGGSANDVGDIFEFRHASFSTPLKVRVTASSGGVATGVEIADAGVWTTGSMPLATDAGGFTRVQTYGSIDMNGNNLQVNITAHGLATVAVNAEGDYTAINSGAHSTTTIPAGHTNDAATITITYGIKSVAITEKGSGYRSAPAVSFNAGGGAVTATLTNTQQNALDFVAYIPGGEDALVGEIINQFTTTKYRVRTADGVGIVKLAANNSPDEGEMKLIATDSWGSTYYVIRLQEHLARVVQKDDADGFQFASGSQVKWTFGEAVEGSSVTVANK